MARRSNDLFIGKEYLNKEGRMIKHPALIKLYASVNANKITDSKLDIIGLDLETNHLTGQLKLLGAYDDGKYYHYYGKDFTRILFAWVRYCKSKGKVLSYWNRLDPFVIFRTLLENLNDEQKQKDCMERFGKVSGDWDRENNVWKVNPVIELDMGDGCYFGIIQAIRSSIQFYYRNENDEGIQRIWAYDIAQLFESGLEKEATSRFSWYSKISDEVHKVDWKRFETDQDFRKLVLKSNELDAKACCELALHIMDDFKKAFNYYPKNLISQGSLARAAIVAVITNMLDPKYPDEKELRKAVVDELKSIGIMNHLDRWADEYGKDFVKDMYALFTEAYSGGYIESIRYGYASQGWFADIASAYPAVISQLWDLRDCHIVHGTGEPPDFKNTYTFIRGTVNIPDHVNYHPITIKHWHYKETNIRAVGTYKASYIKEERDFLLELGATFTDETWYAIQTTGAKSVLANVTDKFIELRKWFLKEGDSAQYMAKISANSEYGILFEAVPTHEEQNIEKQFIHNKDEHITELLKRYRKNINLNAIKDDIKFIFDTHYTNILNAWHNPKSTYTLDVIAQELETQGFMINATHQTDILIEMDQLWRNAKKPIIEKYEIPTVINAGYRAGEFWNPLYASIITAKTRLLLAKAAHSIEQAGGKPIILMTDSITWQGTKEMMPKDFVRDVKTLGYFETPQEVKDIVCLGTGRYGFDIKSKDGWYSLAKRRGLNIEDLHDEHGIAVDDFNWISVLQKMKQEKTVELDISVRTLVSVGMIVHRNDLSVKHLGRIVEEIRSVQAVVGKNKRLFDDRLENPHILATTLVDTMPIECDPSMFGSYEIQDQTLPYLRNEMMKREYLTATERKQESNKKGFKRYYKKNKKLLREDAREKYQKLKDLGITAKDAARMCHWSDARIEIHLEEENK